MKWNDEKARKELTFEWLLAGFYMFRWRLDFTGYVEGLLYRVTMLRLGWILDETI